LLTAFPSHILAATYSQIGEHISNVTSDKEPHSRVQAALTNDSNTEFGNRGKTTLQTLSVQRRASVIGRKTTDLTLLLTLELSPLAI